MNYTQQTFFGPKDSLPTSNPLKNILGTDVDTELADISAAIASKTDNVSGTFTATCPDMSGSPTFTAQYAIAGNVVTLNMVGPGSGGSTTTHLTYTGLPGAITPTRNIIFSSVLTNFQDNGSLVAAVMNITTGGIVQFSKLASLTGGTVPWQATGTKGTNATCVSYVLN